MRISTQRGANAQPMDGRFLTKRAKKGVQQQLQAKKKEMEIREAEEKRIQTLREKISEISVDEMDAGLKKVKIESLSEQIAQIYEERAKREEDALAREIEKREQEMEEKRLEQEKADKANMPSENTEEARQREDTRQMVTLAISQDALQQHRRVKAGMAAEAGQLKRDIENDVRPMQIGLFTTIKIKSGYSDPGDFKNRHLAELNRGIAGMDAAITAKIGSLFRNNARWGERNAEAVADERPETIAERAEKEREAARKEEDGTDKTEVVE